MQTTTLSLEVSLGKSDNLKGKPCEDRSFMPHAVNGNGAPRAVLYAVADGMGGHPGGDIAAEIAVAECGGFRDFGSTYLVKAELDAVFNRANREILSRGVEFPKYQQMGTTLSAVAFIGNQAYAMNVGDSPIYHVRGRALTPIYGDDSINGGNMIRRSVGNMLGGFTPHCFRVDQIHSGDVFVICSDGLNVPPEYIADVVQARDLDDANAELLQAARPRTKDDITSLLIRAHLK